MDGNEWKDWVVTLFSIVLPSGTMLMFYTLKKESENQQGRGEKNLKWKSNTNESNYTSNK